MAQQQQATARGDVLDVIPAQPLQRMQTGYATAIQVQVARTLVEVERRALQEAAILGADGYYSWGKGDNYVEGPSKELALVLARCWGNCAIETGLVQETSDAWIFTHYAIDLETGFTLPRQFRQSKKWEVYGKYDEARKEDIRFQIGQSKSIRNVILNFLPAWLTDRAMDACFGGVKKKIIEAIAEQVEGSLEANRKAKPPRPEDEVEAEAEERYRVAFLDKFRQLDVPVERILLSMGRKTAAALTVVDLVRLAGDGVALKKNQATVDELFPLPENKGQSAANGKETPSSAQTVKDAARAKADAAKNGSGDKTGAQQQESKKPTEPGADKRSNVNPADVKLSAKDIDQSLGAPRGDEPQIAPAPKGEDW